MTHVPKTGVENNSSYIAYVLLRDCWEESNLLLLFVVLMSLLFLLWVHSVPWLQISFCEITVSSWSSSSVWSVCTFSINLSIRGKAMLLGCMMAWLKFSDNKSLRLGRKHIIFLSGLIWVVDHAFSSVISIYRFLKSFFFLKSFLTFHYLQLWLVWQLVLSSVKQLLKAKEFIISYLLTFLQEDLKTLPVLLKYETQTLNQCQTITLSTVSTFTLAGAYYVGRLA